MAHAYISPLPPADLLRIVPERALARFSYFSYLAQLQELSGLTIQYTLPTIQLPSRLLLSSGTFDWMVCQTITEAHTSKTLITCVCLDGLPSPEDGKKSFNQSVWTELHKVIPGLPQSPLQSSEAQISNSVFQFLPEQVGSRTLRPLPQTPFDNFFLVGPWTATNLPFSLESTVLSANACAQAVAESFSSNVH